MGKELPGSYPPRSEPNVGESSVWGGHQQGSLASRIAETEAIKDQSNKEKQLPETAGAKGKKGGRQLVVLGMQNRRY